MSLTEGLLIAVIIILTISVIAGGRKSNESSTQKSWDCVDRDTGEITSVKMRYSGPNHGPNCDCPKCASPEKKALKENAEYFTGDQDPAVTNTNSCDGDLSFAVYPFGSEGYSFKDWITSMSVDQQVLKNHAEFVKDRLGDNTQNITGRTYALGVDDNMGNSSNWIGLRRPQVIDPQGINSAQVLDNVPTNAPTKPTFNWSSS